MIEEIATVIKIEGEMMSVEIQRQSSCGACSVKSGCGTNLIASLFGKRRAMLSLPNTIHARPGDRVVLGIRENDLVSGSIRLYLLPLAGLLLGALAGHLLAGTELFSIAGGLLGMFAVLQGLKLRQVTPDIRVLRREHTLNIEPVKINEEVKP
ncbi:MAG: SoxR reducing system RseC family protein [Sedimenticolaceae bacterium]|nr:SoxR reducing system RseC family protein [Sedimenticolaceae bacterium]